MIARGAAPVVLVLVSLLAGGCLSKSASDPIRYFRPAMPMIPVTPAATTAEAGRGAAPARDPLPLRLRRVDAASHLGTRLARRASDVEVGFDDLVRWTDPPAAFVDRTLSRELFEARGLERSEAPSAPRLDVDVLAFEEVQAPERAARIVLHVSLLGGGALLEKTIAAQAPISSDDPAELARAMGTALAEIVRTLGRDVETALRAVKRS